MFPVAPTTYADLDDVQFSALANLEMARYDAAASKWRNMGFAALPGSQAQNAVFAGPASGGAGATLFRALQAADIPTLSLAKISDAGTAASHAESEFIRADGTRPFAADQSHGGHKITNLGDPTSAQDAVTKAYLDLRLIGEVVYQGTWNAATNTPTLASGVGTNGYYYRVSVAGTTTIDGVSVWGVGDWIVFNGTIWEKVDNTEDDASSTVKGVLRLAGDLAGTADSPALATSGVAAGTYTYATITVDAKGRVTSASSNTVDFSTVPILAPNVVGRNRIQPTTPGIAALRLVQPTGATLANDIFAVRDSTDTTTQFRIDGVGNMAIGDITQANVRIRVNGSGKLGYVIDNVDSVGNQSHWAITTGSVAFSNDESLNGYKTFNGWMYNSGHAGSGTTRRLMWSMDDVVKITLNTDGKVCIGAALSPSRQLEVEGDVAVTTVGKGLQVKEGANAKMGVATLVGGTVTVSTTAVTASSRIQLTIQSLGTVAVPKAVAVTVVTAGTSFVITSADATDTSVVAWMLVEPA